MLLRFFLVAAINFKCYIIHGTSRTSTSKKKKVSGWWGIPTPLKNDGVKFSWDDEIPNIWKVIIHSCSKPPTSYLFMMYHVWMLPLIKTGFCIRRIRCGMVAISHVEHGFFNPMKTLAIWRFNPPFSDTPKDPFSSVYVHWGYKCIKL